MNSPQKNKKKVALITGGGRGIGQAIVFELANQDFTIVLNYYKSKREAEEIEKRLKQNGRDCFLIGANISNEEEVKKMFTVVRKKYGSLDILVNNAGIIQSEPLGVLQSKHFDDIMNTNLRGSVLVSHYSLPLLKKKEHSKIIFIASSSAFVGSSTQFSYAVSKAGLIGAVRALALELAPFGILVNAVVPGYIRTQMASSIKSQMKAGIKKIPLGRIGEPEEVAKLVAFLASSENTYITGQCIHINGGRYMS